MEQDRFLNDTSEQVVIYPSTRIIEINNAKANRAYGLFDAKTGVQVTDFVKGNGGQIEFSHLDPSRHYDVGAAENTGDDKPQFAIAWNYTGMRDDTDEILKNSDNLPVVYPHTYYITDKGSNGVFDLEDDQGEKVGQVAQLSQQGDKPEIRFIWSMKMKDDTKE